MKFSIVYLTLALSSIGMAATIQRRNTCWIHEIATCNINLNLSCQGQCGGPGTRIGRVTCDPKGSNKGKPLYNCCCLN
ncbi:hypothetical protein HYFRA_00005084 [Hymenoscyphus fraxineus]|uniref:Uncharacterized protein n=1 Tax=Hymenoscyphus fraxineus TaxID=746836 RepID=A0A9N9LD38_9HELO|nr:hypothetical protein HYFRA_00005084 [Hymenoscyphus fraxineus]